MSKINKTVIVSIIGRPNVGKSTLTNKFVGFKVAIVSKKPQTTRTRITGVFSKGDCQFVLLDTPGLHKARSKLGDYMVKVVKDTATDGDVALLVVEPNTQINEAEEKLIEQIKQAKIPSILVINKIDKVLYENLLEVIAKYSSKHDFNAIIPVSAKTGEGIETVINEIEKFAIESQALFPQDMVSDQPERVIASEIIREKLLLMLDKEVPHGVAVDIDLWKERENGIIDINATIYCEKSSHKGIIIGKGGEMLKRIGKSARMEIEKNFDCKIYLELWVKVKEDWRNKSSQIRSFGYENK